MRIGFCVALVLCVLAMTAARAQTPQTAQGAQTGEAGAAFIPELQGARQTLATAQKYRATCDDIRRAGADYRVSDQSVLMEFQSDRAFLDAIGSLCAFGNFDIDATAADGTCTTRRQLNPRQIEFIRNIPSIKTETATRRITLRCVGINETLLLRNFEGGGLDFRSVTIQRLLIAYSDLPGGITMSDVGLQTGFGMLATQVRGEVRLTNVIIGDNGNWNGAIVFDSSRANSMRLVGVTVAGNAILEGFETVQSLELTGKSVFKGNVNLKDAKIGGHLLLLDVDIEKQLQASYAKALRVSVDQSILRGQMNFDHLRADTEWQVTNSELQQGMLADFARATEVWISNVRFGRRLLFRQSQLSSLSFVRISKLDPSCGDCNISIANSNIWRLRTNNLDAISILADDGRFHTVALVAGTLEKFTCSDCLVEQYLQLTSRVLSSVDLRGTEIRGTLLLADNEFRVCWTQGSNFDLAEVKMDALAANAENLMVERSLAGPGVACGPIDTTAPVFVPTRLTGARYRTVTGGRMSLEQTITKKADKRPLPQALTSLPSAHLIKFIKTGPPQVGSTYDPQPYEELAAALARSGEHEKAKDIRVAKIDAMVQTGSFGVVGRVSYGLYNAVSEYGLNNERAIKLFLVLLALGAAVHLASRGLPLLKHYFFNEPMALCGYLLYSVWFSLDHAIPPLHLGLHELEDPELSWLARNYYYAHRVIGTVLLSFFAAGAAGVGH